VRGLAVPALLLAGCGTAPAFDRPEPDYGRPFEIVLTQYSVPVVWGLANPGAVGGWDDSITLRGFTQGITHRPVAHDVDDGFVNYVLHPLAGSETHLMARRHGWSFGAAFLFDVFASVSWEYFFENVFERPSRIDLMTTAPIGALLGELRWALKRAGVGFVDPLGGCEPVLEMTREGPVIGVEIRW